MSLILEALRKSEAERRRGETPTVYTDLPASPRTARRRLPAKSTWWIAVAVAAVAALLGARMLLDRTPRPQQSVVHVPVARQRPTVALSPVPHLTPAPLPAVPTVAKPSSPPPAPAALPHPAIAPVDLPAPTPAPAPVEAPRDDLMQLSDLAPEQRKALPPLKLSMHMWNDDPAQRFVILDGNRLHEGDRVGDAVVTSIVVDGVVLDWNGRKLKLPIR